MDGKFLTDRPNLISSDNNVGNEDENRSSSPLSYTEIFYREFPFYLSIGMTAEQYWDGDATLVIYFRKAEEIRKERKNEELWLQGMYIYDSISRLSPILHAFAKKGTKPHPYPDAPYPINKKTVEDAEVRKAKAKEQKGLMFMEALMAQNNKKFSNKEGS